MLANNRQYSLIDRLITQVDDCLQTIFGNKIPNRPSPAENIGEPLLNNSERRHSAALMRVNHSGEVCAQALYHAQSLVAHNREIRSLLTQCAAEETDHLAWCHQRLNELHNHRSYLNLFWYWNSFLIGLLAGLGGDSWSLGFVEETEIQVGKHLQSHLNQLPNQDDKSRVVIQQMHLDETQHAHTAKQHGAVELPAPIKMLMTCHAKVMTTLAYWI